MRKFLIAISIFSSILVSGQTTNVLFIGNSYTYLNDMPQIVVDLASSVGDNMTFQSSCPAGYTLYWHTSNSTTLGLIHQGGWNFVVLQEYSLYPSELQPYVDSYVYPSAQYLDNEINAYSPGAETVFYMTWGRKDGDAARCPTNPAVCTYIGMDDLTRERYMTMASANRAIVSPVGAVWRYLRANYPSIELFDTDGSHPSTAGSYASACAFYTTFFRKDPSLLTYNFSLSASEASIIRNAVKSVVYDNLLTWHIGEYDPDSQHPSTPSGLTSGNITTSGFTLSWNASSDNIGVTAYLVYRNGTLVSTVTGTSANITGLSASTTYSMTVRARDAANNISDASNALNVTTSANIVTLTVSGVTANNKVYNGTTAATLNTGSASLAGVAPGDDVTLVRTGATGTFANGNVGTNKTVTISGFTLSGTDASKYILTQPATTASITAAVLTITGVTVNTKVYNGTLSATLNSSGASLLGVISGDDINLVTSGATGTFANNNIGTGKSVTTSGFTLSGTDAGNYSLTQPALTGNITAAPLTISGITASNKVYDGTTAATINIAGAALVGVVSGDAVTLISSGVTGVFENANTGVAKTVFISGYSIGGTDVGNYTLTSPTTTANITGQTITVSGVTANSRVYNGTTAATLNTGTATLVGVIPGDQVTLVTTGAAGTFVNKNIGSGKTVTTSGFSLSGADANKYMVAPPSTTASITAAGLTITGVSVNTKVYNGSASATLNTSGASLSGVFGSDNVTIVSSSATASFSNDLAGNNKPVTISGFTLGGTDAGNYTLTQPSGTGNITPAGLTISGVTANNKVYDGTTTASLNVGGASLTGTVSGDAVTLNSSGVTGAFANSSVGTAKIVTISGFTLGGSDAGNYTLTQPTATANISGFPLTISGVTAGNKIYNGTTAATLNTGSAALVGVFSGDAVTLVTSGASGTFANKNVGSGKTVTTSGFTLSGADAIKYVLTQPSTSASITVSGLIITGLTANTKVYDGTTSAVLNTGNLSLSGVFGSDNVTIISSGAIGSFSNNNVGTAKFVSTTGFALGGTDAGNYTLTEATGLGNITARGLTISGVTAVSKVYNGTTAATINTGSAVLSGAIPGDAVTLVSTGAVGTFANKNVGTGKTVTISGFTISGADAVNYALTQPSMTANITSVGLTVSGVTANTRAYNGTTTATLNTGSATLSGVLGSDIVTIVSSGATGTYANKNIGTGKPVTVSGITLGGTDAANYTLTQPSATGIITAAALTVTGVTVASRVYDGTATATLNTASAALAVVFGSDIVILSSAAATGTFANQNAGAAKPVTTSGFAISGTDAGNYSLTQPTLSGTITVRPLTVTANDLSKNYRSVLTFTGNEYTPSGLINGDVIPVVSLSSPGAAEPAVVGKYIITISGGTLANYNIIYVNGSLTVEKDPVIATAENKTKIYGSTNPALTITYSGFVKGEDASVLDSPPVASTGALESSNAGNYPIILTGGSDNNYEITLVNGTLEIEKAELTVKAEDKTRIYGAANPEFSLTYSGFISGQDLNVIDTPPIATTEADVNADAGEYEIDISGALDNNYSFVFEKGTLTITKADQEITFKTIPSTLRVTQQYHLEADATSKLPVAYEVSDPEMASLNGNVLSINNDGNVTITARQEGDNNWNSAADVVQTIETLPTFDHISSLFTPNADGMNDYWYIPDLDEYGKTQVTVYNRYGQVVYKSDSYKNDWDGTWNGNPLPSAAYYYLIKSSEKGYIKGVVNIVR